MKKILSVILCLAMIFSLAVIASAAESYASTPATGTAYKLGLYQGNTSEQLYFSGTTRENYSYYLATTTDYDEAVDVYVESATGGYRIYFKDGSTKTYIDIYQNGTYVNLRLTTDPTAVYTWNSEYDTFTTTVGTQDYYIGTYNTFDTLSASKVDYISSSFPCHLYTKESSVDTPDPDPVAEYVTSVSAGTAYKLGCYQETKGQQLYFIGTTANTDYYMSTSQNVAEGVDVYVEEVSGGYRLYFKDGSTKTYIDIYQNGDYVNLRLTTEPTAVYTWNAEYDTFITTVSDTEYYIGTYSGFTTLSASKVEYISTSFPCHLYATNTSSGGSTSDDDTSTGGSSSDDDTSTGGSTSGGDTSTGGSSGSTTGTTATKPTEPKEYHATQLDKLSDGDTVVIYSVANSSLMTPNEYTYEGSSYSKIELEQLEVSVKNKVVTYGDGAVVLTVHIDGDKVSFTTPDGKYLYADGTDVKFVDKASEYTDFILEATDGGYFIKCATATYNDNAQYLEVYNGYFTCYGKYDTSDPSLYTFQFFEADPESSAKTGDSISVFVALLLASAAGIAVIGKKKEF